MRWGVVDRAGKSAQGEVGASGQGSTLNSSWNKARERLLGHLFRAWTACAVLAAYVFGWLYAPEILTWWKRTTTGLIEAGCDLLPYPWGDRIEATVGNFGLWVQITLAIVALRILVSLAMLAVRRVWGRPPSPGINV